MIVPLKDSLTHCSEAESKFISLQAVLSRGANRAHLQHKSALQNQRCPPVAAQGCILVTIWSHLTSVVFECTFCVLRSEEHTSELQSRGHLVCRLLLEKKKIQQHSNNYDKNVMKKIRSSHQ